MRVVCAGCQKTIAHVCPFCSAELEMEVIDGRTWYRCHETMTTIYFDPDNMKTRNALCDTCQVNGFNARQETRRLSFEDQQTIAALDGAGNRGTVHGAPEGSPHSTSSSGPNPTQRRTKANDTGKHRRPSRQAPHALD